VAKIKYDFNVMKYISLFESLTGAKVKDCIADESIIFIIAENEIGKAVGKKGSNIKRIEGLLKKKIKVIEFNSDIALFVRNLLYPTEIKEVKQEEGILNIYATDTKTRGIIIGRDHSKINWVKEILKRYFDIKEIKVL